MLLPLTETLSREGRLPAGTFVESPTRRQGCRRSQEKASDHKQLALGWLGLTALLLLATTGHSLGQTPSKAALPGLPKASPATNVPTAAAEGEIPTKTVESKLIEARAKLEAISVTSADRGTNAPAGESLQDLSQRRALLHRMVRLYEQQLAAAAELESLKARKAEIAREAQTWTRFAQPLPYSIHLSDGLREELQAERLKIKNGEGAAAFLDGMVEASRDELNEAEGSVRQLNERLERTQDSEVAARLALQRELERLRSQMAAATLGTLDAERLLRREELASSRIRLELLQRQVVIADAGAKFTQADLDQVTTQLEWERGLVERDLAEAQKRRLAALEELRVAREQLPSTTPENLPAEAAETAEMVSLRQAQLETTDIAIRVYRLLLEGVSVERTMWELRFAAYDSRSVATLSDSERRLKIFTQRLDLWRDHEKQQLDVSSSEIQLQQTRLNNLAPDSELWRIGNARLVTLRERDDLFLRSVRGLERIERLAQRWADSLRAAERKLPIAGRVQNMFSDGQSFLRRLWTFEIFTAEDTISVDGQKITGRRSITIGKIVMALLILVVGYWASGMVSYFIEPLFVRRLKIERNQATLIRRWVRAFLIVSLVVFSLLMVKIPLTVFAFAGGALAIGLGFGMQTLIKNFVSGLIILFERPFRVGNVLDVNGQRGIVTSVGLRASVLEQWDGTETLIPNSTLLENNLCNWTYSNRRVRFTVTVGVAYGSDARRVIQLLREIAERHGLVEKTPAPQVYFTEFGSSALCFELRFWVDVTQANAAQVSSDLRLMITATFAEQGIVIAFPQQDLHLHATRPIAVELIASASTRGERTGNGESRDDGGQRSDGPQQTKS